MILIIFAGVDIGSTTAKAVLLDENEKIVWHAEDDGKPVTYKKEPESAFWQRFMSGFIKMLPVEGQL